jgi:hypothetical protein
MIHQKENNVIRQKSGQGAFKLTVMPSGITIVDGVSFSDARAAYEHFRPYAGTSSTAWNICYHLIELMPEDML